MDPRHRITEYSATMAVVSDRFGTLVAILHGPAAYVNALALVLVLDRHLADPAARGSTGVGMDVCA